MISSNTIVMIGIACLIVNSFIYLLILILSIIINVTKVFKSRGYYYCSILFIIVVIKLIFKSLDESHMFSYILTQDNTDATSKLWYSSSWVIMESNSYLFFLQIIKVCLELLNLLKFLLCIYVVHINFVHKNYHMICHFTYICNELKVAGESKISGPGQKVKLLDRQ